MAKKKSSARRPAAKSSREPFRFAHPFYTTAAPTARSAITGMKALRMTDFIADHLEKIPPVKGTSKMALAEIIGSQGAAEIEQAGALIFHAVGDTGKGSHTAQEDVADAMSKDYDIAHPERSPAFFFHLGDVNYFRNTDEGYREQFYTPYKHYPGKIIAIPGNHDGEVAKGGQTTTLMEFKANFCQKKTGIPAASGDIMREMIAQLGVYWMLDTPFVQIIGLYSNVAENPGFISAKKIGTKQKTWLIARLKEVAKMRAKGERKGLIIGAHHPPFSSGGHSGSTEMLADIDDCCTQAGVFPDAFLAAHAHNYQRHMRTVTVAGKKKVIPYLVAGGGGRSLTTLTAATGQTIGDHVYAHAHRGFGYLKVTATATKLIFDYNPVRSKTPEVDKDHVEVLIG